MIWKVNNLHVTWLDWSCRHPQACYDLWTPTLGTGLVKIPGSDLRFTYWEPKRERMGICSLVGFLFLFLFFSFNQRALLSKNCGPEEGRGWERKWWRLLEAKVGGKFLATGFGFEWIQESFFFLGGGGSLSLGLLPGDWDCFPVCWGLLSQGEITLWNSPMRIGVPKKPDHSSPDALKVGHRHFPVTRGTSSLGYTPGAQTFLSFLIYYVHNYI